METLLLDRCLSRRFSLCTLYAHPAVDRADGQGYAACQDMTPLPLKLPPKHLFTCTVGRNRSQARCSADSVSGTALNLKGHTMQGRLVPKSLAKLDEVAVVECQGTADIAGCRPKHARCATQGLSSKLGRGQHAALQARQPEGLSLAIPTGHWPTTLPHGLQFHYVDETIRAKAMPGSS